MKFLVAGATGYTGRHVVSELRRRGRDVVAHIRPDSRRGDSIQSEFESLGVEVVRVAWVEDEISEMLASRTPTHVFALLGTTKKQAKGEGTTGEIYQAIDYELSSMLVRAAQGSTPQPHFIYLSSLGVKPGVRNAYLAARAKLEAELKASGLTHTIVRPSFITGSDRPDSRPAERGAAAVADGILSVAGLFGAKTLRDRYSSLDGASLAHALVELADSENGRSRIVTADELRARVPR